MDIVVRYGRAMRLVTITPQMAAEWLATLPANMSRWPNGQGKIDAGGIDPGKVRRYAQAMRDGTWKLMEMPIVYRNGRLLSSRHRLAAIIEYGHPVDMYVSDDQCPK